MRTWAHEMAVPVAVPTLDFSGAVVQQQEEGAMPAAAAVAAASQAWLSGAERIVQSFAEHGEVPYMHSLPRRASDLVAMPLCCGLCCVWSCAWRVLACPFQCCCKGAGYMCSNNGCTDGTDACVAAYYDAATKRVVLPAMPAIGTMGLAERTRLRDIFIKVGDILDKAKASKANTPKVYGLVDALFKQTLPGSRCYPQNAKSFVSRTLDSIDLTAQ